jgi:hypothetical protein
VSLARAAHVFVRPSRSRPYARVAPLRRTCAEYKRCLRISASGRQELPLLGSVLLNAWLHAQRRADIAVTLATRNWTRGGTSRRGEQTYAAAILAVENRTCGGIACGEIFDGSLVPETAAFGVWALLTIFPAHTSFSVST